MHNQLILAKIVVVSGAVPLGFEFDKYYIPEVNMYMFESTSFYDPITGNFEGVRRLHDRIIRSVGLPSIPVEDINYVSVDVKSKDKNHTYLITNSRGYQITDRQKQYLKRAFEIDYI